jgi:hypothetical protein
VAGDFLKRQNIKWRKIVSAKHRIFVNIALKIKRNAFAQAHLFLDDEDAVRKVHLRIFLQMFFVCKNIGKLAELFEEVNILPRNQV